MRSRLKPLFHLRPLMLSLLLASPAWAINGSGTFTVNRTTVNEGGSVSGRYTAPDGSTGSYQLFLDSSNGYVNPSSVTVGAGGIFVTHPESTTNGDSFTLRFVVTPDQPGTRLILEMVQGAAGQGGNSEPARVQITSSGGGSTTVNTNPSVTIHSTMGPRIRGTSMPQIRAGGTGTIEQSRGAFYYDNSFPALSAGDDASSFQTLGVSNADSDYKIDTSFPGTATVGGAAVSITVRYTGNMNSGETFTEWIGFGVRALQRQAELSITKASTNTGSLVSGSTVTYNIVARNAGPASADGAPVRDTESAGLLCRNVTCTASGGARCPTGYSATTPVAFENGAVGLGSANGVQIPTFPSGSAVTFTVQCSVTAKGF